MVSSVNYGCICYIFILKNNFEGVVYIKWIVFIVRV